MKQIIRLTESDLHKVVKESVSRILNEICEGTPAQNRFIRDLCKRYGIEYDSKYDSLTSRDASGLIGLLKDLRVKEGEQPPTIEQLLQSFQQKQPQYCAFLKYENVTPEMVNRFWSTDRYAANLVDINNIRPEFRPAYEKAKKNVAMLDYPMKPYLIVYFDRNANLYILNGHHSEQNHLRYYYGNHSLFNYFELDTAYLARLDKNEWELLYDGDDKSI